MKNKSVLIGILGGIVVALIIVLVVKTSGGNPVKNTKWLCYDGSVLELGSDDYTWTDGENVASGKYNVYTGSKATKFLTSYSEKYSEENIDTLPEGEVYGFQDEIEAFKTQITSKTDAGGNDVDKAFVLEEKLDKTVVNGEELDPISNTYLVTINDKEMVFTNILDYTGTFFSEYSEEDAEATFSRKYTPDEVDSEYPDKNLTFEYSVPKGYVKSMSNESYVTYSNKDYDIIISIMKDIPLYGISDEYPNREEYKDGYKATRQVGAKVTYNYLFEKDGVSYTVECCSEEAFDEFVDSIKL